MKIIKVSFFILISIVGVLILTFGIFILIAIIQAKAFVPSDYVMWINKSPASRLVLIYEYYAIFVFFFLFNKAMRTALYDRFKGGLIKRYKKWIYAIFAIFNIVILYTILFNVSVITNAKIIDYSFFSPQGREYSYNDVKIINTGVYGKKQYIPFSSHSKGDFYYIIELNDGTKIDLTEMGGSKDDEDPRFIIEKLDAQFVDMGIEKISSTEYFEYATEHLDKIYTDKILNILKNTKR